MKTRKQIVKEFLDQKAKATTLNLEKKESKTDASVVKSFYKALADRDTTALKDLQAEIAKQYDGQSVGTDANGGYLVPVELSERIREQLVYISPIRSIATVISNMPAILDLPLENAIPTTYWVGEGVAPTLSKSTFNKVRLVAHKIGGFGKFTHESLVDTAVNPDLQNFVADRFAVSLAQKENDAFVNGDGTNKPYGFRSNQITPRTGAIADKTTGVLAYKDLVKAFYGVHPASRANGVWAMPTEAIEQVVGMTDPNGRPIYVPAMSENAPATILGKPVYEIPEIPTNLGSSKNETEIWFGDFKNYLIGDREGMRINFGTTGTDLESDVVSLVIFARVAGMPTYGDSFYKLTGIKVVSQGASK